MHHLVELVGDNKINRDEMHFDFERMVVWERAMVAAEKVDAITRRIPYSHRHIKVQLIRASQSVVLNIAEGAGEFSRADKARFYRIARRSATETAGALIYCKRVRVAPEVAVNEALRPLKEVVLILTTMTRNLATIRTEHKVESKQSATGNLDESPF